MDTLNERVNVDIHLCTLCEERNRWGKKIRKIILRLKQEPNCGYHGYSMQCCKGGDFGKGHSLGRDG